MPSRYQLDIDEEDEVMSVGDGLLSFVTQRVAVRVSLEFFFLSHLEPPQTKIAKGATDRRA